MKLKPTKKTSKRLLLRKFWVTFSTSNGTDQTVTLKELGQARKTLIFLLEDPKDHTNLIILCRGMELHLVIVLKGIIQDDQSQQVWELVKIKPTALQ